MNAIFFLGFNHITFDRLLCNVEQHKHQSAQRWLHYIPSSSLVPIFFYVAFYYAMIPFQ